MTQISDKKHKQRSRKTGLYYSFFTIILVFCFLQIGYGAILNVSKIISYQGKMITLKKLLKTAQERNQDLKTEKKVVTSDNSLESIARNNLKMAAPGEVMIIINEKPEEDKTASKKWEFPFKTEKKNKNMNIPENTSGEQE